MNQKSFQLAFLLLCFIKQGFCQIELGVKGGYAYSWPGYGEIELPEDAQTAIDGFNVSVFIGTTFESGFGLSTHPGFSKRGAACFPGWQPVFEGDSKVFLDYFELPFLVHKKFDFSFIKLVPSIGYCINYLHSATLHEEQTILNRVRTVVSKIDIGNESDRSFNRLDHGFYFNLSFEKTLLKNHFVFFNTSYYHGMKDYDKLNTSKNRTLSFNLGFGYII